MNDAIPGWVFTGFPAMVVWRSLEADHHGWCGALVTKDGTTVVPEQKTLEDAVEALESIMVEPATELT